MPASSRMSPSRKVEAEVISLGLTTAVQPAASAKGSFWLTMRNGKFHGVISDDHADRLTQHDAEHRVAEISVSFAVKRASQRRGVAPDVDRALDFAARLADRLAAPAHRDERCLASALYQVGGLEQDTGAFASFIRGHGRSRMPGERPSRQGPRPSHRPAHSATRRSHGPGCGAPANGRQRRRHACRQ